MKRNVRILEGLLSRIDDLCLGEGYLDDDESTVGHYEDEHGLILKVEVEEIDRGRG